MPNPTVVVAAVVFGDNGVLIAQRGPEDPFPFRWEFPGGKAEPGEHPESALVRECREELGVEIRVLRLCDAVYYRYDAVSVLLFFYHCDLVAGEPRALGCREVRFVPVHELGGYDFLPADRDFIARLG